MRTHAHPRPAMISMALGMLLGGASCFGNPSYEGRMCTEDRDCPVPLLCLEGACHHSESSSPGDFEDSKDSDGSDDGGGDPPVHDGGIIGQDASGRPIVVDPDGGAPGGPPGGEECPARTPVPDSLRIINDCDDVVFVRATSGGCTLPVETSIPPNGSQLLAAALNDIWMVRDGKNLVIRDVRIEGGATELSVCSRLLHRFSFNGRLNDSVGGGAALAQGVTVDAQRAVFAGTPGQIQLPIANTLSALSNGSIEFWATWDGPTAADQRWVRIFDFGVGRTSYLLLSPVGRQDTTRFAIKAVNSSELALDGPGFVAGVRTHVVITFDAAHKTIALYMDGSLVSRNEATPLTPASVGRASNVWLGRSPNNDPYLRGSIAEFRVYRGVLTPAQVSAHFIAGPDVLPSAP